MVSTMDVKKIRIKGISPLIAAVLLIVFTVAIGAVVLNWMTQYTKGTTEKAGTDTSTTVDCAKQILDISDAKYNQSGNEQLTVFVQNLGSVTAQLNTLTLYDNAGNMCVNNSLGLTLAPGEIKIITQNCSGKNVDSSAYTVRIASSCGASDTYTYPQTS